ncbi:MAG: helicase-related protein, partial [Thermoplasmatales archaeon]
IKIIVATQVGEEGLDIPSADTVIFYEPVPSEIRSIQRKGRTGRFGRGRVFILLMENSRDLSYLYSANRKERKMRYILSDDRRNVQTTFDIFK